MAVDIKDPAELMSILEDKYGPTGFKKAEDYLYKALVADLVLQLPDMDTNHLKALASDLGQLWVLSGVLCNRKKTRLTLGN
jgi:hypothetical protein